MDREEYYEECLAISFEENGIECPPDKLKIIAADVHMGAQMESESFGDHCIPNPLQTELDESARQIKKLQEENESQYRLLSDGLIKFSGRNPRDYYLDITNGLIAIRANLS